MLRHDHGVYGGNCSPTFAMIVLGDLLEIKEKIGGEKGAVANLQRSRGHGQTFSFIPCTFRDLAKPMNSSELKYLVWTENYAKQDAPVGI